MFYCKINEGIFFKYFDHFEYLFAASCQTDVRFNARSLCNLRLCDLTCVCGNNMLHLVICAAWISASVNVTLFEQLWKTSSRESSHAAHMLFSFCHYLSSNCLHLPSGSSPVHHSPPLRTSLPPLLSSPHLSSICLLLRSRRQPARGRLHLPGAAADAWVVHSRRRRRLLSCRSSVEEQPCALPDAPAAPAWSPLTAAP